MNKEEKITISVNEEDVQNIINAYEKDIEYINQLEKENQRLKEIEKEHQKMNGCLHLEIEELKDRIDKAIEYIEKDTRWFDSEYASIYGTLCTCAGAKDNRLEVMVNPSNLLEILKGDEISGNMETS